ncbi:MAG: holo-ACP synthase [Flavipsychrobacter sp.]|nr:holo-ACP synthase [Flavipsychrobacter sp.]
MTKQLDWENDTDILKRVFSNSELQHDNIPSKIAFLSGRFAAKEAVLKCLGTGMQDGISLTDIQVLQTQHGKPTIELSGEVKKLADELGINSWHISITHSETNSIAFVISEKV